MKFRLFFYALLALILPATAMAELPSGEKSSGLKNTFVLIIRHAEKPDDGYGLSAEGEARAQAYTNYFKNFAVDGQSLKPDYLFAAADSKESHRPSLTLEPVSKALGLTVDNRFKNKQFSKLVDELRSQPHGKTLLICWHHGEIPELLQALGADPEKLIPDAKWPSNVFGWLILLHYDSEGRLVESKRISEDLMPDDMAAHASITPSKN